MRQHRAFTKLQTILVIDLVIVALAATGYYFVQSNAPPTPAVTQSTKPAMITLANLTLTPDEAVLGQPIRIEVNATNVGGEPGYSSVNLFIDDFPAQNKTLQLAASESAIVEFSVTDQIAGTHMARIGNLTQEFLIKEPAPPITLRPILPANFSLSGLSINRTQAGIGEPVRVQVQVTNIGGSEGDHSVNLMVNGTLQETKTVTLPGGNHTSVEFVITESAIGTFVLQVGNLTVTLSITEAPPTVKPAEFVVTDLSINPPTAETGQPIEISVVVTNIGEETGVDSVVLLINDQRQGAQDTRLSGGEIKKVTFVLTEQIEGSYNVKIGSLQGILIVKTALPKPADIRLYNLVVNPYESWAGDTVKISVFARNNGDEEGTLTADLSINGESKGNQTAQLKGAQSITLEFTETAPNKVGVNSVKIDDLTGTFLVVPTGTHTLSINLSPVAYGVEITLNGNTTVAPYSEILPVGTYTVTVPTLSEDGVYYFTNWEDSSGNPTRTVDLQSRLTITAYYGGGGRAGSSCPSLYIWNGSRYVYVSEVSNHGWLGYINYLSNDTDWPITFYRNNPWDYIPLDNGQLQPDKGSYKITLLQRWDEIFYLDQAYLYVVDHPSDVNVYSTMVEQYLDPNYMGQIYTVRKNPLTPVSAVNEKGENVLPQISKEDGVYTPGINGIQSPAWDNITWNKLSLNLGNLSDAKQIKLVVKAIVDWGSPDDYTVWLDKFFAQPVPNGTQITPPPVMEVKDANGNWVSVPESRQVPIPPDGLARTFVVDLTGLFLTNDYSLRISNFWNVTFDYVGVDTTPQQKVTIQKIDPSAYLYKEFNSSSAASGNFTRYGNVTDLLLDADDKFVIGRQGDAVSLSFSTSIIAPLEENMTRDFFLYDSCWFKDMFGNWGFGFGFTVDPLPFHDMSGFPYPPQESYPSDLAYSIYLQEWNTRAVEPPALDQ